MSFHNNVERRSYVASVDLDACMFHAVDLVANVPHKIALAAANGGFGILLNKPKAGEDASVAREGEVEVRVGAAVQAGQIAVAAGSGWLTSFVQSTQVASGGVLTTQTVLGRFVTGAASGMLAALELDPQVITVQSI